MKNLCIFGAGKKGMELYDVVQGWNTVAYFIDNDEKKQGRKIDEKIDVISFEVFLHLEKYHQYDVIVSCQIKAIENQLESNGIEYSTFYRGEKCYFNQLEVNEARDAFLVNRFKQKSFNLNKISGDYTGNWYRKSFFDEENKSLVSKMEAREKIELPSEKYSIIYQDELYENRPGMRLIYYLIREYCHNGDKIGDLGCGHGFLLQKLDEHKAYDLVAFEGNESRGDFLRDHGLNTIIGDICDIGIENDFFDALTCLEVLEHVTDVDKAISEIYRILKPLGYCWITVPEGEYCDCSTHVRQFTVNSLVEAFIAHGFFIDNAQRIPCLNNAVEGHIIMQCRKDKK